MIIAIHYYVLENCDFKEARLRSINLGKKRYFLDLGKLILFHSVLKCDERLMVNF